MSAKPLPHTVWRYYLPSQKHQGWCLILLGQEGFVSILGDMGNWSHYWGRSGCVKADFREEFLRFDRGYLRDKLSYGRTKVFNADKTRVAIVKQILEWRRARELDYKTARVQYNNAQHIICLLTFGEFLDFPPVSNRDNRYHDYLDLAVYEVDNAFGLDWWLDNALPRLRALIKEDLATDEYIANKD